MNVSEAVATRRSIRAFQDRPVDPAVLRRVLEQAQLAPSGCNFQPWQATVLAGEPLRRLQARMLASQPQDPIEYDFSAPQQSPPHRDRLRELGAAMYGSIAVAREDTDARAAIARQNLTSFGAPALLVCYFERFMAPPQWADVGMWMQTVMLLLRGEGLDSCPQEWMALYARLIKDEIGVPDESHILFCGLAIGYRDAEAPVNNFARSRAPLDEAVRFVGFEPA